MNEHETYAFLADKDSVERELPLRQRENCFRRNQRPARRARSRGWRDQNKPSRLNGSERVRCSTQIPELTDAHGSAFDWNLKKAAKAPPFIQFRTIIAAFKAVASDSQTRYGTNSSADIRSGCHARMINSSTQSQTPIMTTSPSVVDLKFLSFAWHSRSRTSNP
jgi:hypothetical protein